MLVLSRKRGQSIQIADDVTVTVLFSTGNRVPPNIDAPWNIRILRTKLNVTDDIAAERATDDADPTTSESVLASEYERTATP